MKKVFVSLCALLFLYVSTVSASTVMLSAESNGVRSCGYQGPRVETFVNGFNLDGTIHGVVKARGQCPCSGRGCRPYVYFKTTERNWSLTGATLSNSACAGGCAYDPNFSATDTEGRQIYNVQIYTSLGLLYRGFLNIPDVPASATFAPMEFKEILIGDPAQE